MDAKEKSVKLHRGDMINHRPTFPDFLLRLLELHFDTKTHKATSIIQFGSTFCREFEIHVLIEIDQKPFPGSYHQRTIP